MNNNSLWSMLIEKGYTPVNNIIILKEPLKVKVNNNIKLIKRLEKINDTVKVYCIGRKYSGRLAN